MSDIQDKAFWKAEAIAANTLIRELEALCRTSITFFGEDFDDDDIDSSAMSSQYTAHYKALIAACERSQASDAGVENG